MFAAVRQPLECDCECGFATGGWSCCSQLQRLAQARKEQGTCSLKVSPVCVTSPVCAISSLWLCAGGSMSVAYCTGSTPTSARAWLTRFRNSWGFTSAPAGGGHNTNHGFSPVDTHTTASIAQQSLWSGSLAVGLHHRSSVSHTLLPGGMPDPQPDATAAAGTYRDDRSNFRCAAVVRRAPA